MGRIAAGKFNTAHGITDIQKPTGLSTLAINSQRVLNRGLDAESVQGCPEYLIVVEPINERIVHCRFINNRAVYHSLIEIGRADAPNLATKMNVMRVVNLRTVVQTPGLLGNRHRPSPPIGLNFLNALSH